MLAIVEVSCAVLIGVRLTLKADVSVCHAAVKILYEPEEPLYYIPHIEEHIGHFAHLCSMDAFMPHVGGRHYAMFADEQHSEKIYRLETLKRDDVIIDYFHDLHSFHLLYFSIHL